MLAEIAAANAAFKVIKTTLMNGRELVDAGKALGDYFGAKSKLQQTVEKKGGRRSELEEFMALEKLRQQEEQLREAMVYAGRPGLWNDWLAFQAKAARDRRADEKRQRVAKVKRQQALEEWAEAGLKVVLGLGVVLLIIVAVGAYLRTQG